jgi:molybdopterin molybdotransferase
MLSVADAQRLVLEKARPLPAVVVELGADALGLILAEDVASDLDMPPYDKALMDGFSVRSADLSSGQKTLRIIEEVTAGQTPRLPVGQGEATRIMTGAPLPSGADAVVQSERTRLLSDKRVAIEQESVRPELNIVRRGREMQRGQVVLAAGTRLRPQELGILATVGRTFVRAYPPPRVAVVSTGDELVDASQQPGPGQIRNGNGPMLLAQARRAGGTPVARGIAHDTRESLRTLIKQGLRENVLVLSGGVSAGKLDLVPEVLHDLGVQPHFHKIEMKPGKPVFFGSRGDTLVFGLPGNPVSALVCFELFVRPAIRRLRNETSPMAAVVSAVLGADFTYRTDRPTYYPARLTQDRDGRWQVAPVSWSGSGDLLPLTRANALMIVPAGEHRYFAGNHMDALPLETTD